MEINEMHVGSFLISFSYLVFYIFACMSITKTDTEAIRSACGTELRTHVMADVIIGPAGVIVFVVFVVIAANCMQCCCRQKSDQKCIEFSCTSMGCFVGAAILLTAGTLTINTYTDASNKAGCFDALSSTEGGIKSPSVNLGDPLLAQIALSYGIGYIVTGVVVAFIGCGYCVIHWDD